jgi:hypothetical protein
LTTQFCDALFDVLGHRLNVIVCHMCACLVYSTNIWYLAVKVKTVLEKYC